MAQRQLRDLKLALGRVPEVDAAALAPSFGEIELNALMGAPLPELEKGLPVFRGSETGEPLKPADEEGGDE